MATLVLLVEVLFVRFRNEINLQVGEDGALENTEIQ